ncbi:MAG TPA: hypothetical protein VF331_00235 [Polyangiales bacterium]
MAVFEAKVQRTKNRLIAIPADVQRTLRLARRVNNHIVLYSIRPKGRGRWNHLLSYLTYDNEFAVPVAAAHIGAGDAVEVKIHRVIPDADALGNTGRRENAGSLLSSLAEQAGDDERSDGSQNVDEYLNADVGHG